MNIHSYSFVINGVDYLKQLILIVFYFNGVLLQASPSSSASLFFLLGHEG